jgi:hypothetical protein
MQSSPKEREDQQDLRKRSRRKVRREPCTEKERRTKAPDRYRRESAKESRQAGLGSRKALQR